MKFILVALIALIAISSVYAVFEGTPQEQFAQFKQVFGKTYKSAQEERLRSRIFGHNLMRAKRMTENSKGATQYGVTQFSDLTTQEFKHLYLMKKLPTITAEEPVQSNVSISVNADGKLGWDQSCIGPVLNQGQCGSCWAFSATEEIQSMCCIQKGKLNQASEQQIVDCDKDCYGCDGGWTYLAYAYVMKTGGLDSSASYPYRAVDETCKFKKENVVVGISDWRYVGKGDENAMKTFVVNSGPLSVCVDASSWQFYNGGVITDCGKSIDHCVQITGYDANVQGKQAWKVRNSWGTSWGLNGYLYVEFGKNMCGINEYPTTVTCDKVA